MKSTRNNWCRNNKEMMIGRYKMYMATHPDVFEDEYKGNPLIRVGLHQESGELPLFGLTKVRIMLREWNKIVLCASGKAEYYDLKTIRTSERFRKEDCAILVKYKSEFEAFVSYHARPLPCSANGIGYLRAVRYAPTIDKLEELAIRIQNAQIPGHLGYVAFTETDLASLRTAWKQRKQHLLTQSANQTTN